MSRDRYAPSAAATPVPRVGVGRSVYVLIALFIAAFGVAIALQVQSRLGELHAEAAANEQRAAAVAAAKLDAVLAHAWGAAGGAAEVARFDAASPRAVTQAAARARGVSGAALISDTGQALAATDPKVALAAQVALRAAGDRTAWAGAVADEAGAHSGFALLRRGPNGAIVALMDPAELAPEAAPGARVALLAADGSVLAASTGFADETVDPAAGAIGVLRLLSAPASWAEGARVADASGGGPAAVGVAPTALGGLMVASVRPIKRSIAQIAPALVHFALLALAPLAAVAALLLLLGVNTRRAREAEAEAARAVNYARLTADGARAGLIEWRLDDDIVSLSDEAQRMLRAHSDTLALFDLMALAASEDRPMADEAFSIARRTGALDARFRVGEGPDLAWIELRGLGLEDEPGAGARRLVGTVVDVTQRRAAEIRASTLEQRLREAISSYTGPFALWDSRRRIVLWNESYARAFGLGPDVLRANATYENVTMHATRGIARELEQPDPSVREIELVSGQWLRLVERRTERNGIVTIGVDISDLKRQEADLKESRDRLRENNLKLEQSEMRNRALARQAEDAARKAEDASAAKSVFLANMSHELRTPLNAINGFSEIMANELFGPLGNAKYVAYAKDIFDSGSHLLDLISDILDMAKIEAGRYQIAPHPMDPHEAIDQAMRLVRSKADEKGLKLVAEIEPLPEIEADHRAVKQMLLNLLSNAVKFTDRGAVMVHGRATEAGVELRVVDTGPGIPAEALPRLAKPFEQVHQGSSASHAGTGLGLALTKSLAEMHGGRMEIESEVGRGTMVAIHLPRRFGGSNSVRLQDAAE